MNPYLENPELWSEVHSRLIVNLADSLGASTTSKLSSCCGETHLYGCFNFYLNRCFRCGYSIESNSGESIFY
ncbi:DUF4058 family protein [Aphanothece sacrum]|uniref:DUF4058 family protein n=1 Tax=Aphanothece sacrum TaxID=1122 RepID=UPI00223E4C88|nr:DUF4058 family protein [Aphanothece sacrum]